MFISNNRKSQVTIFIIAGLVVISLVGIVIYFATATQQVSQGQTFRRTPVSFRDYIEICAEEIAIDAINNIGYQGGYMELPFFIRANDAAFISLGGRREFGVPSWYFRGDLRIPTISSMEIEISNHVEENINNCLSDFSGYSDYNVTERQPLSVNTVIARDSVSLDIDYPVDVIADRASQSEFYEDFNVDISVKLGKMHELARRIIYSEIRNMNFERELFNLMSMHPDIPITHQSFSPRQERWSLEDIRNEINLLIFYNLQRVRFKGTDYLPFDLPERDYERFSGYTALDAAEGRTPNNAPEDAYDFFNLFYDPNDLPENFNADRRMSFDDIKAIVRHHGIDYLSVNARPSSGGMLVTNFARFPVMNIPFPIQMGHFVYDVDLLLEINLLDEDAYRGRGFVFRFAMPVSIKSNAPSKESVAFNLESNPVFFDDPCNELQGDYIFDVVGLQGGMLNQPLRGAEISYDCIQFGCSLGQTRAESGTYRLSSGIPVGCSGGFINVQKDGYLPKRIQHLGNQENVRIHLDKLETFTVQVNTRPSFDLSQSRPVDHHHVVIGVLEPHDYDDFIAFEYVPGEPLPEIELLADNGLYDVQLFMIDYDGAIAGGYTGEFSYNYYHTAGRNRIVFSVAEYSPTPMPLRLPENQLKVMEYLDSEVYVDSIAPRFT